MKKIYDPIDTKQSILTFNEYISQLKIQEIDYFAIGIQNVENKKSKSLMSHPDWQSCFSENNFVEFDPIRKAALMTNRNIIPFKEIDHVDNAGKFVMEKRKQYDIKDGLILMQRKNKYNFMITLGTGYTQFDTYSFIKKYHDKLSIIKQDLIKIIEIDSKKFLMANNLSNDAK